MPRASSPARTDSKCAAAASLQKSANDGAAAISVGVLPALGVEHAQRVADERLAALLAERVAVGLEVTSQGVDVTGAVGAVRRVS